MRANKRKSRNHSVVAGRAGMISAVIVTIFMMAVFSLMASSRYSQLKTAIGEKERTLVKLEENCRRASADWEAMKSTARMEHALKSRGMAMIYPKPEQVIHMDADGRPRPNQISVAMAKQRSQSTTTAQYRPQSASRSTTRARR